MRTKAKTDKTDNTDYTWCPVSREAIKLLESGTLSLRDFAIFSVISSKAVYGDSMTYNYFSYHIKLFVGDYFLSSKDFKSVLSKTDSYNTLRKAVHRSIEKLACLHLLVKNYKTIGGKKHTIVGVVGYRGLAKCSIMELSKRHEDVGILKSKKNGKTSRKITATKKEARKEHWDLSEEHFLVLDKGRGRCVKDILRNLDLNQLDITSGEQNMSIWTEAVRLCGFNAYESDIKSFIVKTIPKNASSFCKCCIDKLNAKRTKTFNSKLRYLNSTDFWVGDIEDYHDVEEKLSSYKDITM